MPNFSLAEENGHRTTVRTNNEAQAISFILQRMRNQLDTRHTARGTLSNQSGQTLGDLTLLPISGSAQYQPRGSDRWYTVRIARPG